MPDEVIVLKHGELVAYRQCDACGKLSRSLSGRSWCPHCEWECSEMGQRARAKLALMDISELQDDPSSTRSV
jgi:hypothetical protein